MNGHPHRIAPFHGVAAFYGGTLGFGRDGPIKCTQFHARALGFLKIVEIRAIDSFDRLRIVTYGL
jgi:hypothetical protein